MVLNTLPTDKFWSAYWGVLEVSSKSSLDWSDDLSSILGVIDRLNGQRPSDEPMPQPMTPEEVNEMIAQFFKEGEV